MYSVNEQYDIEVSRGDTAVLRIDLSGRDLPEGTDAVFTVKQNISDEEPVLQKRFNASDEVLSIVLTSQETNLEPGVYYWDVRLLIPLESGGYEVYTPMEYAAFVVLDVVGSALEGGGDLTVNPDLPLIPQLIQEMRTALQSLHPVGSIYLSLDETDPSAFFGGTWERIEDTFLLAAGSTYAAGDTGGEAEHILTIGEMPSHSHSGVKTYYANTASIPTGTNSSMTVAYGIKANTATSSTGTTGGTNVAHNNMPPYLAVYVWKRVA